MTKKEGKVIQFEPRRKPKLKSVNYEDPAKKALLEERARKKIISKNRQLSIKGVGIFFLICVLVYILKYGVG